MSDESRKPFEELKPCPSCGGRNIKFMIYEGTEAHYCRTCQTVMHDWNRRAPVSLPGVEEPLGYLKATREYVRVLRGALIELRERSPKKEREWYQSLVKCGDDAVDWTDKSIALLTDHVKPVEVDLMTQVGWIQPSIWEVRSDKSAFCDFTIGENRAKMGGMIPLYAPLQSAGVRVKE